MRNTSPNSVGRFVRGRGGGFTLIEVMFAIVLVGMAIAGLTMSSFAYTQSNSTGVNLATAEYLIGQIHELTATLPVADPVTGTATFGPEAGETLATYDDVDDFAGTGTGWRTPFSPPIDANRQPLTALSAYQQQVKVQSISSALTGDSGSYAVNKNFVRVTVQILKGNRVICSQSWIRARY
jgi:prepilin-type N-terminal cleavage/methylation domain-containing protein